MLKIFLNKYKWLLIFSLLVLYSAGLWHICSGYQENSYNKERIAALREQSRLEAENRTLSSDLSQALAKEQAAAQVKNKTTNEGIINEATKHPEFNCRLPDSVRDAIANKLKTR